jgi:uncharacterized membrane protein
VAGQQASKRLNDLFYKMEARPRFKIELSRTDKFIEASGYFVIIVLWILTIFNYIILPETIPIHFNASGQPDNYGSKSTIFILAGIGTIIFTGMTVLNKFPHTFNFPIKITEDNALRQYTNAMRLIRFLKLAIGLIFSLIVLFTGLTATGKVSGLGFLFLPFTFALIIMPVIYFIIQLFRKK